MSEIMASYGLHNKSQIEKKKVMVDWIIFFPKSINLAQHTFSTQKDKWRLLCGLSGGICEGDWFANDTAIMDRAEILSKPSWKSILVLYLFAIFL